MTLVDTSVIVAWMDTKHEHHAECKAALVKAAAEDELAISAVTYAELSAGGRVKEAVDQELEGMAVVPLDAQSAWRAGLAFRQYRPKDGEGKPVLPDFFIRAQALENQWRHLTNDRRRTKGWVGLDWVWA